PCERAANAGQACITALHHVDAVTEKKYNECLDITLKAEGNNVSRRAHISHYHSHQHQKSSNNRSGRQEAQPLSQLPQQDTQSQCLAEGAVASSWATASSTLTKAPHIPPESNQLFTMNTLVRYPSNFASIWEIHSEGLIDANLALALQEEVHGKKLNLIEPE
ncbi:unnamed protein product, partial [Polarella glacialis]